MHFCLSVAIKPNGSQARRTICTDMWVSHSATILQLYQSGFEEDSTSLAPTHKREGVLCVTLV
jgi:hypothetical protein